MKLKTTRFDIQEHLTTPEERAADIAAALEDGNQAFIQTALSDVARAEGRESH